MARIIRLTESDLMRLVRRIIREDVSNESDDIFNIEKKDEEKLKTWEDELETVAEFDPEEKPSFCKNNRIKMFTNKRKKVDNNSLDMTMELTFDINSLNAQIQKNR